MPIGGRRRQLAKSADSGKCGNKAGLPSTVGVSMAHRRAFKMGKNCCKNDDIDGCRGPTDRPRVSDNYVDVTLSSTYDYSNRIITVTLSGGVASKALAVGDFTYPILELLGSGTPTKTEIKFIHTGLANTLVPGKEFTITLNADTVKNAAGKFLSTATTTQQVNSSTKIKILTLNTTYAIVQFSSTVSNASNAPLASTDFVITGKAANGTTGPLNPPTVAAFSTGSGFIGDQVGGNTYKLVWTQVPLAGEVVTITPDVIHETSNGTMISAADIGILGQEYPAATTATTSTNNPRIVV